MKHIQVIVHYPRFSIHKWLLMHTGTWLLGANSYYCFMKSYFTAALLCMVGFTNAQQPDSVRLFVDSAVEIMQTRSVFAAALDWKIIRDSAQSLASDAKDYAQAAPAIRFAFNLLGDKHGWLVLDGKNYHNPFMKRDNSRINAATLAVISKPAIRHAILENNFIYLSIPFFGGQTTQTMNAFAQRIQDSLGSQLPKTVKGIIIDLRLNGGGNVFPMVVGLGNILGNGAFTESVNAAGETDGVFEMKEYSLTLLDTMHVKLSKQYGNFEKVPVAVLTGPATGSSGEQLAIILSVREKTMLVGERTAGYITGNNGFLLPGRDNGIVLGESYTRDRNGKIYKEDVVPGITVIGGDDFENLGEDKKVKAALAWLKKQSAR